MTNTEEKTIEYKLKYICFSPFGYGKSQAIGECYDELLALLKQQQEAFVEDLKGLCKENKEQGCVSVADITWLISKYLPDNETDNHTLQDKTLQALPSKEANEEMPKL
jgi:hypothetical protein